jgi:hypothetical protein
MRRFPAHHPVRRVVRRVVDRIKREFNKVSSSVHFGAPACEPLEGRQLLSATINAAGWTVVTPATGDRVIYVSSSAGNDNNSGLSPSAPVQTLWKGISLMRNDTGDELLLKAGDVWHDSLVYWRLSGRSAQDPMVLGSYGTGARPTIMSGTSDGFATGASSNPEIDNLDILGIHFWADGRDPSLTKNPAGSSYATGINILSQSSNIVIENCLVQDYAVNMNFQDFLGPQENVSVRRNISIDSYSTSDHSQGLYATGVTNLLIEGNLFDHDGWNDAVPGAEATWYNHDCYLSGMNNNCVVEDNTFAEAAGYGLQARSGGVVKDNLFINDPVGMTFGLVNGATAHAGGVTGSVTGNVFVGGANIGSVQGGSGLQLGNISSAGVTVSGNLFADGVANAPAAITLTYGIGQSNAQDTVGINNLTVSNNTVYNWNRGVQVDGGMTPGGKGLTAINNVTFSGNDFDDVSGIVVNHDDPISAQEHWVGNIYDNVAAPRVDGVVQAPPASTAIAFTSPTRQIASYMSSIGGQASVAAFLSGARLQSEQAWDSRYTADAVLAYMDQGFTMAGSSISGGPLPVSTGSVSGTFFYDSNVDGTWNSGEPISPDWYVYLDTNNNGVRDASEPEVRADDSGRFSFNGLAAGTYYVRPEKASGWTETTPANGAALVVTVSAGQNVTNQNIGEVQGTVKTPTTTSISGTFFYDSNGNGTWDAGESTSPSWLVYIDVNNDGAFDGSDVEVRANGSGQYTFSGLSAGTYHIRAATASGWTQTSPANGGSQVVTFASGQAATNINFGEVQGAPATAKGSIAGSFFYDTNANGNWDSGESTSPLWYVYVDVNKNGVYDSGDVLTRGDSNGHYTFVGLSAGTYEIRAETAAGLTQTTPANGAAQIVTVGAGQNVANVNFGEVPGTPASTKPTGPASISGTFFYDTNANGAWDANESASPQWYLYIDANNDGKYDSGDHILRADTNGRYTFSGLAAGTYVIRAATAPGWQQTTPANGAAKVITVAAGQNITSVNFGERMI